MAVLGLLVTVSVVERVHDRIFGSVAPQGRSILAIQARLLSIGLLALRSLLQLLDGLPGREA